MNSGESVSDKATEKSEGMNFPPSPTYFPPSPPPPLPLLSNSMVVHGLSDISMDNPPLYLRYENIFDAWPTTLSPQPPPPFPPSSNQMVAFTSYYKKSMENPPQSQLHEDIVELPPSIAEDWLWLKQETVQYWIAAVYLNQRETPAPRVKRTNKLCIRQGHDNYYHAPLIKRSNKIYIRQGHDSEWVAKIRLRRNWVGVSTFNTAEDARDRAVIKVKRDKSRLNVPKRSKKVAEATAKSILRIPRAPAGQQDNPGEMAVGQFNSGCLGKRKMEVNTPGAGERGNKKTKRMRPDAAKNLNGFKRYGVKFSVLGHGLFVSAFQNLVWVPLWIKS